MSTTFSLTFGNGGENHVGMQTIGKPREYGTGWSKEDITNFYKEIKKQGKSVNLINLNHECVLNLVLPLGKEKPDALLLHVKNYLSDEEHKNLMDELNSHEWDRHYYDTRRKKVLNKRARHNLLWGDKEQSPEYENKKGTIVPYKKSPLVYKLKLDIEKLTGEDELIIEGNKYLDSKKNGIGFHGDTERVIVACVRVGAPMPMKFAMFNNSKLVGKPYEITINGGDLYIMSEEAVGTRWKHRSEYTWRHAAGAPKYLKIKEEK